MTIIVINGNLALISGGKVLIITREIDYAIRVLRAISDNELHSVQKMSETEDIPCHFAYKIVKKLEKAGLLIIHRGAMGGCQLATDLSKVSLYDVFNIIGEERTIAACVSRTHNSSWRREHDGVCTVHNHLCKIQHTIDKEMKNSFISDLLKDN